MTNSHPNGVRIDDAAVGSAGLSDAWEAPILGRMGLDDNTAIDLLRAHDIQPSAQRVAVARYVLTTTEHPSADQVFSRVRGKGANVSRATVYNTLHRFTQKGLLKELVLAPGRTVFDPCTTPHHHFIDDETGGIHDVAWESLAVEHVDALPDFAIDDYQVVLHGRKR